VTKYAKHGLLSLPKNPQNGGTVPYDEALEMIQSGYYGEQVGEYLKQCLKRMAKGEHDSEDISF